MRKFWHKLAAGAGLALCLLGSATCMAAPQLTAAQQEEQEYKTGIHALKSEPGAYLLEHVQTDYFNGAFLTSSDGHIFFTLQVLKDGQLLLEGCFMTDPKGSESALLTLDAEEGGLPHFRFVPYSARNNEVKTILDTAYWRTRQEELKQQNRVR